MLEVSKEPALATDIDGIHNIPTHNQDHALKSPSVIPRQMTPGVICCQADSSLRPARGQWWNTSDLNRSDILSARQVATPSSPVSQIKM